jgi:hypothetical protein
MRSRKLTVATTLELDLEVETRVTPGTRDYFDRGYGQYLPGDPAEVEILRVLVNGVDVGADALSKDDVQSIEEQALEEASDAAEGDALDAAEARWEAANDR